MLEAAGLAAMNAHFHGVIGAGSVMVIFLISDRHTERKKSYDRKTPRNTAPYKENIHMQMRTHL